MRRTLLALLMLAVSACADASGWDALWRNADQRAEQLLRDGDAAGAAKLFADPRRKAYAELAAGNYAQAAQTLKAIDEPDAHYNRGNALAHAGQLADALAAYDAALARDPHNQDARRNRDLVAKAQKQNPPQSPPGGEPKSPPDKSEDGQSGAQKKGGQGNDPKAASPSGATGPSGPSEQNGQPGNGQAGSKASDGKDGAADKSAGQTSKAGEAGQADTRAAANQRTAPARPAGQNATPAPAPDSAHEASRDAAAGANTPPAAPSGAARPGDDAAARLGSAPSVPRRSEQQLAQEQWLRSIPDDPGGLLRRKFLIEHLMRQQKSSP